MSRPQDPPRSFLPFGNPFRMILPKGSSLPTEMLDLLNTFEENLAGKLKNLKPAGREDVLSLSWMRSAMESLCEIHADMEVLTTALEFPVSDWENKWIDVYLHNSMKLLDISSTFKSEIYRLKQGDLLLLCSLVDLDCASTNQFPDKWKQHLGSKNPSFDGIFPVINSIAKTLEFPKIKNSPKGKVLMQAMYGVKVATLFICSVFAAAFSGSAKKLADIQVPKTCLWAEAYADLQTCVNTEIRNMQSEGILTFLKELEAVEAGVKKLCSIVQDGVENPVEAEVFQKTKADLEESMEQLYEGLDLLEREMDGIFRVVFKGRKELLANLRLIDYFSDERELNSMLKARKSC